jgi:hypothetical protein
MNTAHPFVSLEPTDDIPLHGDMQEALPHVSTSQECLSVSTDKPLSDEAREEAIQRAGRAVEAHWNRFEVTRAPADRTQAITACNLMAALIRGRARQ